MDPLFSSRAGIRAYGERGVIRADWPLGKIMLNAESLGIDALWKKFELPFSKIERLQMGWMNVRVIHHAPGVPSSIKIFGIGLPGRLRKAIAEHNLPVQV